MSSIAGGGLGRSCNRFRWDRNHRPGRRRKLSGASPFKSSGGSQRAL